MTCLIKNRAFNQTLLPRELRQSVAIEIKIKLFTFMKLLFLMFGKRVECFVGIVANPLIQVEWSRVE